MLGIWQEHRTEQHTELQQTDIHAITYLFLLRDQYSPLKSYRT